MAIATSETSTTMDREQERPSERKPEKLGFVAQMAFGSHLDPEALRALAENRSATWKVGVLVALAGAARAFAYWGDAGALGAVANVAGALFVWAIATSVVWLIASESHDPAAWGRVARCGGIAAVPALAVAIAPWGGPSPEMQFGIQGVFYGMSAIGFSVGAINALQLPIVRGAVVCLVALAGALAPLAIIGVL